MSDTENVSIRRQLGPAIERYLASEVFGKPKPRAIPDAAVEAAARALHPGWHDHATPDQWREIIGDLLEAAGPHMLAEAWGEGHESGFWNGRMTHGDVTGCLIGVEHAKASNPYRPTP